VRPLPRLGTVGTTSQHPCALIPLLGMRPLFVGAGGEPISTLAGLTALLATPTKQPEVLVDACQCSERHASPPASSRSLSARPCSRAISRAVSAG